MDDVQIVIAILLLVPTFFSIIAHEVAHGWVAYKLGDNTAKRAGRLSFNPLKHVDLFGTIVVPLVLLWSGSGFLFGWAKPVPVNFSALRNPRRDLIWVSSAGIITNLILALIAFIILRFSAYMNGYMISLFLNLFFINLVLAFFNIIPIPPLDGSKILYGLFPNEWTQRYVNSDKAGFIAIIVLVVVLPVIGTSIGVDLDILRMFVRSSIEFITSFLE